MPINRKNLEAQLNSALQEAYEETVREYWRPENFRRKLEELGAYGAANHFILMPNPSQGFVRLWELSRLDLSIEAAVLRGPWKALFDPDALAQARRKLNEAGYQFDEYDTVLLNEDNGSNQQTSDSLDIAVVEERQSRLQIWEELSVSGEAKNTTASRVRELRLYGGARGTFADKERTKVISGDRFGVTVGLLHTGQYYDDDLSEKELIYHYPKTKQTGYDLTDIEATKIAKKLSMPLFVISLPEPKSRERQIRLGWVEDWDDKQGVFLVKFGDTPPIRQDPEDLGSEFNLRGTKKKKRRQSVTARPNQQRFSFDVFKRYGKVCAFCGVDADGLIDAAHICGVADNGSDDPRNGIPLCALHHRALDRHYIGIDPESFSIVPSNHLDNLSTLHITHSNIKHLPELPHREALEWLWSKFKKDQN